MSLSNKCIIPWIIAGAVAIAGGSSLSAQRAARTPDGRPDLQGIWLNNTATPLERPRDFAGKASLTDAEAKEYEGRYQLDRTAALSRVDPKFELEVAGDLDTYEPGRLLPGNRTSMITDPDGRVPALTPEAQRRFTERNDHLRAHYAENPEDSLSLKGSSVRERIFRQPARGSGRSDPHAARRMALIFPIVERSTTQMSQFLRACLERGSPFLPRLTLAQASHTATHRTKAERSTVA